ncbi:MAG: immunoglobulin domain-containing protein, partial [Verrucomicrobiaceae bacterium]
QDDPNPTTTNGPPVIVDDPDSGAVAPGGSYTFSVQAEGLGLAYQWKKGSAALSGQNSPSLIIAAASTNDAGSYSVVVSNVQGSRESQAATLGVYAAPTITVQPLPKVVNEGLSASCVVTATGSAVTYQWKRGSSFISGATSRTLSLTAVDVNDIGSYSVVVSNGAGSVTSDSVALGVNLKPVVNALNLPDAVVSQSFTHTVTAQHSPTTYTFSGLPPGLTGDRITGSISGRPTLAGLYTITVKATNAAGISPATASDTMEVEAFPTDAIGTFNGMLPRHIGLNANLGGRLTLTSTLKGTFSGSVVLGTVSHSFSGVLDIAAGVPPEAVVTIKRKGSSDLMLEIEMETAQRRLTGTLTAGADSLSFSAELPAVPVGSLPGNFTFATKLAPADVGLVTVPQGHCFGGLKVDAKGVASGVLRLSDDTLLTLSSPVGQQGGVVVFALLYGKTGSLNGSLDVDAMTASSLSWFKRAQSASTRSYKEGFGPLTLSVVGDRYTAPAPGVLPLNATPGVINARLSFAKGGAPNPERRLDVSTIEIVSGSPAAAKFSKPNPGIATLTLTPGSGTTFVPGTTGTLTGSFTLMDADPAVTPAKALLRTVSFRGVLVTDGGVPRGLGFFLLPELPSAGPPKTTLVTSRLLSGSVRLEALP